MGRALVVRVRLHAPMFHGRPEWPPSPARLFQALVAGASGLLERPEVGDAFRWLEALPPPMIAAPHQVQGQRVTGYVPNNDLDARGGDPARVADVRTAKHTQPRWLDGRALVYAWRFDGNEGHAARMVGLAGRLYQLGRGEDMAHGDGQILDDDGDHAWAGDALAVHVPTPGAVGGGLLCPCPGSFDSLERRFAAQGARVRDDGVGRATTRLFVQPPKPAFREVAYDASPARYVFELRPERAPGRFAPAPLHEAHRVVVRWRDAAVARLVDAGADAELVRAVLVGRRPGEAERVPSAQRVRLVPLPTLGGGPADLRVRRLLVEVPTGGPLSVGDLRWAFSGLVVDGVALLPAVEDAVLVGYTTGARRWTTVTPVALPVQRRTTDSDQDRARPMGVRDRCAEEAAAIQAFRQAARHAGIRARIDHVSVRREPFDVRGERAERFAAPPRFGEKRLWHVAVRFDRALSGPLVVGDGRYLGLGLLRPDLDGSDLFAWDVVDGLVGSPDPLRVADALRRAVIARAQAAYGARARLPSFITGHRPDGSPARAHDHLAYAFDPVRRRVLVLTPRPSRRLESALDGFDRLVAGAAGALRLRPATLADDDPLLRSATAWRSITPYRVNRHARAGDASTAVERDVREACRAAGLGEPRQVVVERPRARAGVGLEADIRVRFAAAVRGPVLVGRSRHRGGGLFEAEAPAP